MKIFDGRTAIEFTNRSVMLDTNIWITIEGMDPNPLRSTGYGDFFASLRSSENTIVINDYILGEFHNRCCRIEYETRKSASDGEGFPSFKKYRASADFKEFLQSMSDVCAGILVDAKYEAVNGQYINIENAVKESCLGKIDFSDIILREHSKKSGYLLATDDFDFFNCGIDLVTCNPKLLKKAVPPSPRNA